MSVTRWSASVCRPQASCTFAVNDYIEAIAHQTYRIALDVLATDFSPAFTAGYLKHGED